MQTIPIDPNPNHWHVYKDGGLFKIVPRESTTQDALKQVYQGLYPDSAITVKG